MERPAGSTTCGVTAMKTLLPNGNAGATQPSKAGNVPAEEVEAARAQLDARTFRQEFEASFENLSGLVAVSFNDLKHLNRRSGHQRSSRYY